MSTQSQCFWPSTETPFQEMIGHRADVAVRASRSDDHAVRDGGFAFQVYRDDVDSLIVVQGALDQRQH
jgi:hypothetical protein